MQYFPLILFVISTSITPGPNNTLILASGVNHGVQKSLPHYLGIGVGFTLMVIAVGFGAGNIFTQYSSLQIILKAIGVGYSLYLAYKVATASTKINSENKRPFTFFQAVLFQWVNPKAWIMIISAIVTFTTATDHYLSQIIILALAFIVFGFPCTGLWLLFGASIKKLFSNPSYLRAFNIAMAALLVVSLTPILHELYTYHTM